MSLLFIDKYRVNSLLNLDFNQEAGELLYHLSKKDDIGHIILNGSKSSGKKTLANLFITEKYGDSINKKNQIMEFKYANKKIELQLMYSNYHYVLNLSLHGVYDKQLIQDFIKDIAQYSTISMKCLYRIIIIENTDHLTHDAQQSLRRTLEKYINQCRFIFLTENNYNLIEALRSRCIVIKLKTPTYDEKQKKLNYIINKEGIKISDKFLEYLCQHYTFNESIDILQVYYTKSPQFLLSTTITTHLSIIDNYIGEIIDIMKQVPFEINNILKIREKLYDLLVHCLKPCDIINKLHVMLMKNDIHYMYELCEISDKFDNSIRQGGKPIYHLEGYITHLMKFIHS
jgi:replication factor C subunit 3/5